MDKHSNGERVVTLELLLMINRMDPMEASNKLREIMQGGRGKFSQETYRAIFHETARLQDRVLMFECIAAWQKDYPKSREAVELELQCAIEAAKNSHRLER